VRLVDMLFDPFLGTLMDRTKTRIGRYRPWLLAGAPILMVSVAMLFNPPVKPNAAWLVGWLFVYYVGVSLLQLAHASWASVIAANYHERSRVFGVIQVVSVLGSAAALVLPTVMEKALGPHASATPAMGWLVVALAGAGVLLATTVTRESVIQHPGGDERIPLIEYWKLASRPDMRRIIVADFCLMMGPGWMSALYLFYFRSARGFSVSQASVFLLLYIFSGVIGAGVISRIAQRFGKHRTQLPSTVMAISIFMLLLGLVSQSFILLDRAMVADVGDAVRLETGKHRVGLLYGFIGTVQKIALGLSITISFPILNAFGFNPAEGATNSASALEGLRYVYLLGPVFFVMLGAACYLGYKLDDKAHGKIREQLEARDAGLVPHAAE
jgi:Na+/melibiose symporter-like transporter